MKKGFDEAKFSSLANLSALQRFFDDDHDFYCPEGLLLPVLTNGPAFYTEEQALRKLDPTYSPSYPPTDEQVISLAVAKIADAHHDEKRIRDIVRYIGEKRNSMWIQSWLETDIIDVSASEDGALAAAYNFFGITDRTADIDLALLDMNVDSKIQDGASESEANRHADVIRKHQLVKTREIIKAEPNWHKPMGLTNMGNTCYLNCLLQFFFTIEPLRDLVLDFDHYKTDVSPEHFQAKNIIITKAVSRKRVTEAQDCKLATSSLVSPLLTWSSRDATADSLRKDGA